MAEKAWSHLLTAGSLTIAVSEASFDVRTMAVESDTVVLECNACNG